MPLEPSNDAPFVELDALTVKYRGRTVLDAMSTQFRGRAVGLLGPNGAGKSTLIKTLLGFVPPASGTARVLGIDVRKDPLAIRRLIGYMPEHEAYVAGLSAVRLLRYLGELSGLSPAHAMERAHEVLYYVGLGEVRYRPVETYSLGNQQRVKLAQALVHGPRLLILDEPTNALDPEGREEMLRLVKEIGSIAGTHVILCSHIMRDVEQTCDAVVVINKGRMLLNRTLADLKNEDLRTYDIRVDGDRERFLGAVAARGWQCEAGDREDVRVTLPEGEDTRSIFKIARELGMQLRHFHYKRDSLEEIFVQTLREAEGAAAHARA